jgi:CDP-diacylglycerol--glycerol-3-phosphate 3-phosphatidyltransferase
VAGRGRDASPRRDRGTAVLTRITLLRIGLVPFIMALIMVGDEVDGAYVIAACVFVVAAVTDFFDGYLARRWRLTTTMGAFLDTTADKLLAAGTLIALVAVGRASAWVAVVIVGRELMVLGLRGVVAAGGQVMKPSLWGKLKANAQFVAIFSAIVRVSEPWGRFYPDEYLMFVAAVITVLSAVEYLKRFWSSLETAAGTDAPA